MSPIPAGGDGNTTADQATEAPVGNQARKFSYFCLSSNDNLCLGVSPGQDEPYIGMFLQLKPYERNFFKGSYHKKMRWDVVPNSATTSNDTVLREGFLRLEAEYPTLCVDRKDVMGSNLILKECSEVGMSSWIYDLENGLLRLSSDIRLCATVTKCARRNDNAGSCDPTVTDVETRAPWLSEGAVVHAKRCYTEGGSFTDFRVAQLFLRELDCIAGCSPEMQENGKCDEICNNPVCAHDKGECIQSNAPTPQGTFPPVAIKEEFPSPQPEFLSYWWLLFLLLLLCCLTTAAALFKRKRKQRLRKVFQQEGDFDESEGISGVSAHDQLVDDDDGSDDSDETRFKTGSAVALNQLRYHSRAASSNSSAHVNSESVKRRPESSNNDRKYQFEEVGLV